MITGTRDRKIAPAIERIEVTRPPGVFISIRRADAPSLSACTSARSSIAALMG
jgi:hypothetical protein